MLAIPKCKYNYVNNYNFRQTQPFYFSFKHYMFRSEADHLSLLQGKDDISFLFNNVIYVFLLYDCMFMYDCPDRGFSVLFPQL
jgi:hypothetical protein